MTKYRESKASITNKTYNKDDIELITENIYDASSEEISRFRNRLLHYFDILGIKTELAK